MPKIFGLNLVGVLVASIAFFIVGYIWYGVVFAEAWMAAAGISEDEAGGGFDIWMLGGFIITFAQVIGIGLVLKWKNVADLTAALKTAGILWLVFALPFAHYGYLYDPAHSSTMLMIDASHLLVGWLVSAGILTVMK